MHAHREDNRREVMRIVEELVKEGRISTEAFRGTAAIGKKGEATSSGKH